MAARARCGSSTSARCRRGCASSTAPTSTTLVDAIATLAVRGAPALGAAGAFGVALAAHTLRTKRQVRAPRRAHRARRVRPRSTSRGASTRALAAYERGGARTARSPRRERDRGRRRRAQPAHRRARSRARARRRRGADALQHRLRSRASATAPRSASCAPRSRAAGDRACGSTRRDRCCRARASRCGSSTASASTRRSSPTARPRRLMARGQVDLVIVGADRIAANGDVANKIGTYGLAVAARHHQIPFYVAAPASTIDLATATGAAIVIEERDPRRGDARRGAPRSRRRASAAFNPAFDVTPGPARHRDRHRVRRRPPAVPPLAAGARPAGGGDCHTASVASPVMATHRRAERVRRSARRDAARRAARAAAGAVRSCATRARPRSRRHRSRRLRPRSTWWTACFAYEGVARELVARAKYRNERRFLVLRRARARGRASSRAPVAFDLVTWAPASAPRIRAPGCRPRRAARARGRARLLGADVRPCLRARPGRGADRPRRGTRRRGPRLRALGRVRGRDDPRGRRRRDHRRHARGRGPGAAAGRCRGGARGDDRPDAAAREPSRRGLRILPALRPADRGDSMDSMYSMGSTWTSSSSAST